MKFALYLRWSKTAVPIVLAVWVSACSTAVTPIDDPARDASLFEWRPSTDVAATTRTTPTTPTTTGEHHHPEQHASERKDPLLADYLRQGLENNPGLRAAFARWKAAREIVPQVTELPDPELSFTLFVREIETRTGPQRGRVAFMQKFTDRTKLSATGRVALLAAEVLWHEALVERAETIRAIESTWYEYARLHHEIMIVSDNLLLLQQLEPLVQRSIQLGEGQVDILRLQVEIGKLQNRLDTLELLRPALSQKIDAALGLPASEELHPWPELHHDPEPIPAMEVLGESLQASNPQLARMEMQMREMAARAELATHQTRPDITAGIAWYPTGESEAAMQPSDSGDDPIALTLSMNLPVRHEKYRAQEREWNTRRESVALGYEDHLNVLRADMRMIIYKMEDAVRQSRLYHDTLIPRAEQTLELTLVSYQTGNASILDFIDAERELLMMRHSYWQAIADYGARLADLRALFGGRLPWTQTQESPAE